MERRHRIHRSIRLAAAGCLLIVAYSWGQEDTSSPNSDAVPATSKTPLGVRQQRVERMMEDLERKFKVLAQTLQKTEPERAERIVKTLQESKQLLIQQRMDEISKLLDESQLEGATSGQTQVLGDIHKLIALLLDQHNDRDKIREEYERLNEWKKEIESILQEERPQKAESDRLANKPQTLADLAAQIKAVEKLIKQQAEVNQATGEARAQGVQALGKSAGQQAKVREETEKTVDMVSGKPQEKKGDGMGDAPSKLHTADKPAADKPAADKPAADKPAADKPAADKPAADKPAADKPAADKSASPSSDAPAESSGSPSGQGDPASKQPPAPGEKSLRDAVKNQQGAEKNLESGKGKAAQEDQQSRYRHMFINTMRYLREYALGNFKDFTKQITINSAMLDVSEW